MMQRIGDLVVESALVVAIEDGGEQGARVTVELDTPVETQVHGGERPHALRHYYLPAPAYRALLRDHADGASDGLLARRVLLSIFYLHGGTNV